MLTEHPDRTEQTAMDLPALLQQNTPAEAYDEIPVNVFRPEDLPDKRRGLIEKHRQWLARFPKEYPLPMTPYRIGVYIRYFNQTKYEDYLEYHKKQFADTIALCPNWTLVDYYIDYGAVAPNMESAPGWCRLLRDCTEGKVNLIVTQKVSNISRKAWDLTLIIRMLAAQDIGIYFISEDLFTLASYYLTDMWDTDFMPGPSALFEDTDPNKLPGGNHVD